MAQAKRKLAAIYNRYDYDDEKRAALEAWARHLNGILGGTPADNVVTMVAGGR